MSALIRDMYDVYTLKKYDCINSNLYDRFGRDFFHKNETIPPHDGY